MIDWIATTFAVGFTVISLALMLYYGRYRQERILRKLRRLSLKNKRILEG